jgi:hypothetical protein
MDEATSEVTGEATDDQGVTAAARFSQPIGGKCWGLSSDDDASNEAASLGGASVVEYVWSSPVWQPSFSSTYVKRIRHQILQREAALSLSIDLSHDSSRSDTTHFRMEKTHRSPLIKSLKLPVLEPTVFFIDDFNANEWFRAR